MAKYLGGISDVSATWVSASALQVDFTSTNTGFLHQLYYGRRKVAETVTSASRRLITQVPNDNWQNHLTVVAVSESDIGVDHGDELPPAPYNVAKLILDASNFPADTQVIEVYKGDEAGDAVNSDAVWFKVAYDGARSYTIYTPPLNGSGTWNIEIIGRDNRPGGGNLGTAIAASVTVNAHPPDFDERFTVDVSGGTGSIVATIPAD